MKELSTVDGGSALLVSSAETEWSTIAVGAIEELLFKVKWTERRTRRILSFLSVVTTSSGSRLNLAVL